MVQTVSRRAVLLFLVTSLAHALAFSPRSTRLTINTESDTTSSKPEPVGKDGGVGTTFADQTCMTPLEADQAVQRFSRLLQFNTVSSPSAPDHVVRPAEFRRLHAWLPKAYPEVWETMEVEQVGSSGLSLLLRWPGTDDTPTPTPAASAASATDDSAAQPAPAPPPLLPVLFISHLDVVPVANETLDQWEHPPFSGAVAEGYIWGRGALDVKVGVAGLLEAATLLIREGWRPQRTLYFAFGQDEEVGGEAGAALTADLLASRGVMLDMIYDEGGSIGVDGYPPYTSHPLALVGTAEKGYATILIQISATGGHSSIPPLDGSSAAAVAGRIITAIDRLPPPARLVAPVTDLLAALAPSTPGLRGWLFSLAASGLGDPWVGRLVAEVFLARDSPETAALVRNTAAITGVFSGFADNVLPPGATVRVNFRLLPGSNVTHLVDYLQRVIGRDWHFVVLETGGAQNASLATPVTPASSPYFDVLRTAIKEVYRFANGTGQADVAPTLMAGGTDSKHYLSLSRGGALRHVPVSMNKTAGDIRRVHGLNERVGVADFGRAVCVYRRLLQLTGTTATAAAGGGGGKRRPEL